MTTTEAVELARVRALTKSGRARTIRQQASLTLAEVAAVVGISPAGVHRWETKSRIPRGPAGVKYGALLRALEAMGISDKPANPAPPNALESASIVFGLLQALWRDGRDVGQGRAACPRCGRVIQNRMGMTIHLRTCSRPSAAEPDPMWSIAPPGVSYPLEPLPGWTFPPVNYSMPPQKYVIGEQGPETIT